MSEYQMNNQLHTKSCSLLDHWRFNDTKTTCYINTINKFGSMTVSEQLNTYPSLYQTLTLSCYQLTVIGLGEGLVGSCSESSSVSKGGLGRGDTTAGYFKRGDLERRLSSTKIMKHRPRLFSKLVQKVDRSYWIFKIPSKAEYFSFIAS